MKIIELDKSVIPACDVATLDVLERLVKETSDVEGIGAYKIGLELALSHGLPEVVEIVRSETDLPIIYDHQKAGNDIPELGEKFAASCKKAGVDAVILFPFAGPETERAWIKACREKSLGIIVGGEMTHKGFTEQEGGFIASEAPKKIYELAAHEGVTDFVVPGNKPEKIREYREFIKSLGVKPVLYSPGLIAQGGEITESGKAAGDKWHAIVGRALYDAKDFHAAAKELVKQLR